MLHLKVLLFLVCMKVSLAIKSDENCGVVDETEGLVIGGEEVIPNEWPWSVAIFHKVDGVKFQFICGGTLVTRRKVITAAHCIHEKYSDNVKRVQDFEIKLGVHDLSKHSETGSITVKPSSIVIHPEWRANVTNFDADIAVINLPHDVDITKFIRPICIWERRRGAPKFTDGIVVGWGVSGENHTTPENIARKLEIPVISNEQCFLDQLEFTQMSSNRTFCGGARQGAGPCKGDSGSGLFFSHEQKLYLGGIVSASTFTIFKHCDVNNYALYTEVFKFIPWLSGKKFNEKSQSDLYCDRYKNKRPERPSFLPKSTLESNEAEIGEFPHMALIAYKNRVDDGILFSCNGILISENFVMSAAHCIRSTKPIYVRLGSILEIKDLNGKSIIVDIKVKVKLKTESNQKISRKFNFSDNNSARKV